MHPIQPAQRVSHKTIFYAMPRGGLRRELIASFAGLVLESALKMDN